MGDFSHVLSGLAIGAPIAGGIAQGRALEQQAGAQAAAARFNAAQARAAGQEEASRIRRTGRRELARQRELVSASGVRLEGSPLDVIAANAYEIEREAVLAEIAGRNTARLDEAQARSAKKAGRTGRASALLSGGIQGASAAARTFGPRLPRGS